MVSLVKNIGLDGTGVTMPENTGKMQELYDSIPLSTDPHFEFIGTGYECYEYNKKLMIKERNWKSKWEYTVVFLKKLVRLIKYW